MTFNPGSFEDANEYYIGQRLMFTASQPGAAKAFASIDDKAMGSTLLRTWLRGLILAVAVSPVAFVLMIAGRNNGGFVVAFLLWMAAWTMPWFIKDHVFAGQWELSLENKGHLVEPAFALTAARLQAKQLPAVLQPRQIRSTVAGNKRYYLSVRQDRYTAYIAVMSYGTDLFVAWTMWREQYPLPMLWNWFVESIQSLFGKGSQFHQVVRSDPARAMREAVHNATRAGVEAAVQGQAATIVGTFGHDLVEEQVSGPVGVAAPNLTPRPSAPVPTPPPARQPSAGTYQPTSDPTTWPEAPRPEMPTDRFPPQGGRGGATIHLDDPSPSFPASDPRVATPPPYPPPSGGHPSGPNQW